MKNRFDLELKSIMEEETKDIFMSNELKCRIMEKTRNKSLREKISDVLNRYIEIPIPVAIGVLVAIIIINIVPISKMDISYSNVKVIRAGSSEIIIRDVKDVSYNEKIRIKVKTLIIVLVSIFIIFGYIVPPIMSKITKNISYNDREKLLNYIIYISICFF